VSEQIGTSTINVQLNLDYQEVDGFHVPKHVSFDSLGAYSINMEVLDCKSIAQTAR